MPGHRMAPKDRSRKGEVCDVCLHEDDRFRQFPRACKKPVTRCDQHVGRQVDQKRGSTGRPEASVDRSTSSVGRFDAAWTCSVETKVSQPVSSRGPVPAPAPGDIAIMDNPGSHKGPAVQKAIRAAGARLLFVPPCSPDLIPGLDAEASSRSACQPARGRVCRRADSGCSAGCGINLKTIEARRPAASGRPWASATGRRRPRRCSEPRSRQAATASRARQAPALHPDALRRGALPSSGG